MIKLEYEKITDNIAYRIGDNHSLPILNTGELIRGLKTYGPYESPFFKHGKIALIYANQDSNNTLLKQLKSQINSKLNDVWHINNVDISEFTYVSSDFDSIKSEINKAIYTGIDGIMLILPRYMPSLYYKLKSDLINSVVPSQFMRHDILLQKEKDLTYYTDNMLVQFVSKLGGKPWVLDVDPENNSDIIIGMGASRIGNENIFCFAMVFRKDGTMLWNEISPIVRKNEYLTSLEKTFKNAVKSFKYHNPDWNVEKLTLHVSGKRPKISEGETKVLKTTISELKKQNLVSQNIKFAILHLNETHPFWLMGDDRNRYHPHEGIKVKLSSKRYLITLSEPHKRRIGLEFVTPIKPLSVEIVSHNWIPDEFYPSAHEVLDEIYYLSKINWRGFRGRNLPVSVNYPKLVARIMANVNRYGGSQINTESSRPLQITPWFL